MKNQLNAEKMSAGGSPGISPKLNENAKEISLFDLDTKDSGFSEDLPEEKLANSPIGFEDAEATILCFSPQVLVEVSTPAKRIFANNKKRLFVGPTESPSAVAANSLKRLKIFELDNTISVDSFEEVPLDFSDKILAESDDEGCSVPSIGVSSDDDVSVDIQRDLVKEAVEKSAEEDLIGDFTKSYALPVIDGSHPDLKCISAATLKDVVEGKYEDVLTSVKIIDSRYPYEFQGGHINGAINIYTKEDCLKLLNNRVKCKDERHILIFHCEFSKERGPNMIRTLRQEDRTRNAMSYPALTYPELYVLEGGYKKFFESFPQHCIPMEYKQMLHPEHAEEMRLFRRKSKTADNVLKTSRKKQAVSRTSKGVRKFLSNDF